MQELSARRGVGLDFRRPADGQRVAGAAEMRGDELGRLVRRAAGPRPAGVIHVVGLRRTEHVEAAERVERLDLLFGGRRDAILCEQFADRAVLAFRGGAVVTPDVQDQGVLAVAEPVNFLDNTADLRIHVFGKPGEYLHQPALKGLFVFGNRVPGRQRGGSRGQLRVLRNPAQLLGALEGALAVLIPAVVEFAFVLVGPFFRDLVRAVRGSARPIHEEWLVRIKGPVLTQPADRIIGEVFAQMIIIVATGSVGVLHVGRISDELRFVLRRFTAEETVEILEAVADGPGIERTGGGGLLGGCIVPLPPSRGAIAVVLEHLGDRGAALRDDAHVSIPVIRQLGDLAAGDAVMVPSG